MSSGGGAIGYMAVINRVKRARNKTIFCKLVKKTLKMKKKQIKVWLMREKLREVLLKVEIVLSFQLVFAVFHAIKTQKESKLTPKR